MMKTRTSGRLVRCVSGAMMVMLVGACTDSPASPWPGEQEVKKERAVGDAADALVAAESPFVAAGGEVITRREVRASDGRRYVIESIRDIGGLPREVRVSRDGQSVARLSNEWRRTAAGYVLENQRLTRFAAGRALSAVDARAGGGVGTLADGPIVVRRREALANRIDAAGVRAVVRVRSLELDGSSEGGACEAEARAVEAAIDDWLLSVLSVAGATITANPVVTWTAYAYQLKKYRDLTRTEAALDQCVAAAGKPIEEW